MQLIYFKISLENFLNQFSIPNKKRAEIKELIVDLLNELKAVGTIANFDIVYKNDKKPDKKVQMLTPSLLSKTKEIFIHEIIHY